MNHFSTCKRNNLDRTVLSLVFSHCRQKNPFNCKVTKSPSLHDRRVKSKCSSPRSLRLICNENVCFTLSWLWGRNSRILTQYLIRERLTPLFCLCLYLSVPLPVSPLSLSVFYYITTHDAIDNSKNITKLWNKTRYFKSKTNQHQTYSLTFKFLKYLQQHIFAWGKLPKSTIFTWKFF